TINFSFSMRTFSPAWGFFNFDALIGFPSELPLVDGNVLQIARPDVFGLRPDQAVVSVLFQNMSRPTGRARHSKDGSEQIHRDSHRLVKGRGKEVDIGF